MIEKLNEILLINGLSLGEQADKMLAFHELLLDWNQRMDLTNIPPDEMYLQHYADSLLPLKNKHWFFHGASLIDIGTGAGFPGMAIAVMRTDMQVCLLDSSKKRCGFLEAVVKELNLNNVQVIHARSEDAARGELRGNFDAASARAVASLRILIEYLLPFVKVGGFALCWKGPGVEQELIDAKSALFLLKGTPGERLRLNLPHFEHYVQSIKKAAPTPAPYPRKAGIAKKSPL